MPQLAKTFPPSSPSCHWKRLWAVNGTLDFTARFSYHLLVFIALVSPTLKERLHRPIRILSFVRMTTNTLNALEDFGNAATGELFTQERWQAQVAAILSFGMSAPTPLVTFDELGWIPLGALAPAVSRVSDACFVAKHAVLFATASSDLVRDDERDFETGAEATFQFLEMTFNFAENFVPEASPFGLATLGVVSGSYGAIHTLRTAEWRG